MISGAILGCLAVILGAFAAHGLKDLISEAYQKTFEIGVRYQMYHALLLLLVGPSPYVTEKSKKIINFLVLFGLMFFSGSIYALATNDLTSFDFKSIGYITPIGGIFLIVAWIILLLDFFKIKVD